MAPGNTFAPVVATEGVGAALDVGVLGGGVTVDRFGLGSPDVQPANRTTADDDATTIRLFTRIPQIMPNPDLTHTSPSALCG
jgi:hypothetical protein